MLQAASLLLGCALSRYLWEFDTTIASIVISITSSGAILYIFIVTAGTVDESCPYQTPSSQTLCYLLPKVRKILRPALRDTFRKSATITTIVTNTQCYLQAPRGQTRPSTRGAVRGIFCAIAIDARRLGRAMILLFAALPIGAYRIGSAIVASFVSPVRRVSPTLEQLLDQQIIALDLRCISWTLQSSSDKVVHLSALKHLVTMMPLADFDPTLAADCFNAFVSSTTVTVNNHKVVAVHVLEPLQRCLHCVFLTLFLISWSQTHLQVPSRMHADATSRFSQAWRFSAATSLTTHHERHPLFVHSRARASVFPVERL